MDKILLADGFEDAFIGVVQSFGAEPKACYDYDACIDILMGCQSSTYFVELPEMDESEALEYFEFNVTQAYVGEHTPAFIRLDLGWLLATVEDISDSQKLWWI